MHALDGDGFLRWAAGVGVGLDPRFPDSERLCLLPPRDHARFWAVPSDPAAWAHFLATMLGGLDEWAEGFLWPRGGRWPRSAESGSRNERVRDVMLRGAGIPDGWSGAVRFARREEAELLTALFVVVAGGWGGHDDVFFVPDHGQQLLQTDHHDVVHVECASEERVLRLVKHLADEGYELPKEPPDWTFKRPAWMG